MTDSSDRSNEVPRILNEQNVNQLAENDFVIIDDFLDSDVARDLLSDLVQKRSQFRSAGINQPDSGDRAFSVRPEIRSDLIFWWEEENLSALQKIFWGKLHDLKTEMNREFFLALKRYECHYAIYPIGAFYDEHVDTKKGPRSRVISTVYYLNPEWDASLGGNLELTQKQIQIEPVFNRLVLFKSEKTPHCVHVAGRERLSLTGWFHS